MASDGEDKPQKWEAAVSARIPGATADAAWSLLGDFCSLHKWLPSVSTCYQVDGDDGVPGCVRYCAGSPSGISDGGGPVYWAKERLVAIDPVGRAYSYEIVENNMGFGQYLATLKVVPESDGGVLIEWSFVAESIEGGTRSGFCSYMEAGLEEMARRVGDALRATTNE